MLHIGERVFVAPRDMEAGEGEIVSRSTFGDYTTSTDGWWYGVRFDNGSYCTFSRQQVRPVDEALTPLELAIAAS